MQNILVVGGNGFIGSAICKAALANGMRVTSLSSSGRPFRTPKGHSPAWTERVEWCAGDALRPEEYKHLLDGKVAVVHTLGILLEGGGRTEGGYKKAVRENDALGLVGSVLGGVAGSLLGGGRNPLAENGGEYERMNRDTALTVCSTFAASKPPDSGEMAGSRRRRAFIYLSAEDIFRPIVPARYIETKRAAERGLLELLMGREDFRAVFARPSLVYHSHLRPLTTPIATLLDFSSSIHRNMPSSIPTPAYILRALSSSSSPSFSTSSPPSNQSDRINVEIECTTAGVLDPSALSSIANALTVPPIHVDHVAEAVVRAIADDRMEGVMDVLRMREVIGWVEKGRESHGHGNGQPSRPGDELGHERV